MVCTLHAHLEVGLSCCSAQRCDACVSVVISARPGTMVFLAWWAPRPAPRLPPCHACSWNAVSACKCANPPAWKCLEYGSTVGLTCLHLNSALGRLTLFCKQEFLQKGTKTPRAPADPISWVISRYTSNLHQTQSCMTDLWKALPSVPIRHIMWSYYSITEVLHLLKGRISLSHRCSLYSSLTLL